MLMSVYIRGYVTTHALRFLFVGEVPAPMARKVKFHVSLDIFINESDLALLHLLGRLSPVTTGPVSLTARALANELQLSLATVRRSCRVLVDRGLIIVRGVRRRDGGRDANTYEITVLGREVLSLRGSMRPQRLPLHDPSSSHRD